ncbi:hypothetical protein FG386_002738 [Cryptosporidium ryanae]|uniref:uncharacterized protein n=1 Tax=Cryptosporidium ryanae TaxID=515981 RepID=UPI003519FA18|nr:hypothetical protein FG386_002738 [Cryptosporidium ryanae]
MKSNNANNDDSCGNIGNYEFNQGCNLEYNNENANGSINVSSNSVMYNTCDINTNLTSIRVVFSNVNNVKSHKCECYIDINESDSQVNPCNSACAFQDNSFYSTDVHSPRSISMGPTNNNILLNDSFSPSYEKLSEDDDETLNVKSMIHLICSDEFLYNAEYLKRNVRISTNENIQLLSDNILENKNNGVNNVKTHCYNKRTFKRLRLSKSPPWVAFQNDNYFSFSKSSIRRTRASVALPEEYYHIPVPNLFFREPIFQLLKSIRKALKKPCEIEQLVNLNPIDPFLVESYLIRSRKIYSRDPKLITDLLLTNIDNSCIEKCLDTIIKVKSNRICDVEDFRVKLENNLNYIHNATKSRYLINILAKINFDPSKRSHKNLLSSLWNCYYSSDDEIKWELLGFQRCDQPYSDFRGVGILALVCLLYFSLAHPIESKIIHRESSNSKYWYSFAVTGINITSWLRDWLNQRDQRVIEFFYKTDNDVNMIIIFCELFSYIFLKFHTFWMEKKPKNILEFPSIAQLFKSKINFPISDKISLEYN